MQNWPHGDIFISVALTRLHSPSERLMRRNGLAEEESLRNHSGRYHLNAALLSPWLGPPAQMGNDLSISAWHSLRLHLTLRTLPQHKLSRPFDLPNAESGVSGKRSAAQLRCLLTCCVWSMMLSRKAAGVYPRKSPFPSAPGPPNWRGLAWQERRNLSHKVVLGSMPIYDSVIFGFAFLTLMWGKNALHMRESVTKCARVMGGFLITLSGVLLNVLLTCQRFPPVNTHMARFMFKSKLGLSKILW